MLVIKNIASGLEKIEVNTNIQSSVKNRLWIAMDLEENTV